MQSGDPFLPEFGHLDSVGRQAGKLKFCKFAKGFCSYFHRQNKCNIKFSSYCWVCTKKLIEIKVRKLPVLV